MVKRTLIWLAVAVVTISVVIWLGGRVTRCRPPELTAIDDPNGLDDLHLDLAILESESWVRQYDPDRSHAGFNLGFYERRVPIIFDMQGRIVHSWPRVRATGRVRLDRAGRLAVIGIDNLVKEYDWDGKLTWFFQLSDVHDSPHHDLMRMDNGNLMILAHDGHSHLDYLCEVDRAKNVVWEWRYADHSRELPGWAGDSNDPTHTNSIRELPPNRWFDAGDARFRPGNILVSSRSLNTIFIIDKPTGKVVWQYSKELDHQHEAVMIPPGPTGEGLILLFNNGRDSLYTERRSRVQAINPVEGTVAWEYRSRYFFSSIAGSAQLLPDNSVLITSSLGGRVFEIRPRGRIVWEWVPPFKPLRLERLPLDYCPQLENLAPVAPMAVVPADPRPFIDADLYRFALPEEVEKRTVGDRERNIAPVNEGCRQILVPPDASLRIQYGMDRDPEDTAWLSGRFRLWIRGDGTNRTLVESFLGGSDDLWFRPREEISLGDLAYRTVQLCISANVVRGEPGDSTKLVWGNPFIESASQVPKGLRGEREITAQEKALREQQLEALGYVD